jgi:hypothetical protein
MNIEQLRALAVGMINLANVTLGVTLVTPIFGSGPIALGVLLVLGVMAAVTLYAGALDILSVV